MCMMYCAEGGVPVSRDYWAFVETIAEQKLPEIGRRFSKQFRHFVDQCLRLCPEHRPEAAKALKHPGLTKKSDDGKLDQFFAHTLSKRKSIQDINSILSKLNSWVREHPDEQATRMTELCRIAKDPRIQKVTSALMVDEAVFCKELKQILRNSSSTSPQQHKACMMH